MAAKKGRQRISYVIESAKASPGHKLGVNGLAVDTDNDILYSGGKDGIICAWDLNLDLQRRQASVVDSARGKPTSTTKFRAQTHTHMTWINDITLAQNNTALVSGSSDLTVKIWRPHSEEQTTPQTIGEHADYVKCVATPPADMGASWVASGGLDRRIYLWDLNGGGKSLEIDCSGEEVVEKGSVYALSAGRSLIANGGPESILRLWDPKSGKRVTKFVGHTANIRAILINDAGDLILSGSSDQTIKLWSVTAGRCMYTFTMHNESVWSLFSEVPDLGVFYSSDRSGMVVKTDVRGSLDHMDDGLSLAVAKEHDSVIKVVACGDYIWTATPRSSINRWSNVDTGADIQLPDVFRHQRQASTSSRPRQSSVPSNKSVPNKEISAKSILRISSTAAYPSQLIQDQELTVIGADNEVEPIYQLPEETIEGQFGLLKFKLMNDRRRVLTVDTAGDVVLWDLIQCKPVRSFGKRHLEDVEPEINTLEAVAPWCSIDTSSGSITVTLDPFNCFDAEQYADELSIEEKVDFREDQRINLGKWILRYLFAGVIDEEIKRDEAYRQKLNETVEKRVSGSRADAPGTIALPTRGIAGWGTPDTPGSGTTPRANGTQFPPMTPGIGLATPAIPSIPAVTNLAGASDGANTPSSQAYRASTEKEDYFTGIAPVDGAPKPAQTPAAEPVTDAKTPGADNGKEKEKEKEKDKDKSDTAKSPSTPFGKKFRNPFGSKKLGRSTSTSAENKPTVEEKAEESESSSTHDKEVDDSFYGVIQRIHNEYDKQLSEAPDKAVETRLAPSLPNDTPVLKLPPNTMVILKEETSGESSNVYIGTVGDVSRDADIIEQKGAMWLGDLLLQNAIPHKEPVKVSFVLLPWREELPPLPTTDNNNRLNANRMLRVRKILGYVAERIDPDYDNESGRAAGMRPEEYLELYCNDQVLPNIMSLATLRAHVWKGGADVVLHYKANGKREIPKMATEEEADDGAGVGDATVVGGGGNGGGGGGGAA